MSKKIISLTEMQQFYNNPSILNQYSSGFIMFEYFMDNYCWRILEGKTDINQIIITHEGQEIKRYGLSDEQALKLSIESDKEALKLAIEEENYTEAARLKEKLNLP